MNRFAQPRWQLIVLSLLLLVLTVGAVVFFRNQETAVRRQIENELTGIAQLKVQQITEWRQGRLDEGAEVLDRPLLNTLLSAWLSDPQADDEAVLRAELSALQRHDDYEDILIVDSAGKILFSVHGAEGQVETHDELVEALRSGQPVLSDLHTGAYSPNPHISVFVPIFGDAGALVLITDARHFLFPLVQSWPTNSLTAETLLVKRDGADVLFLNDLRHQANTALQFRLPLIEADLPAVKAIQGVRGPVDGRDYRDVEVVANLQPIPGSSWYMVTKIDKSEAFAGWNERVIVMLLLALGALLLFGMAALVLWQRQRKSHIEHLYAAEKLQHAADLRHKTVLQSIGDGVIATDAVGRITMLNPMAEILTGWTDAEARGLPLETVFAIVNEETRQPVDNPVASVLAQERIVGLANHTLLIDRSGSERPIADAAAPIREQGGEIQGVVLVFRDQSTERASQRALSESEARNRAMIAAIPDLIFQLDHTYRFVDCWVDDNAQLLVPAQQFLGKQTFEVLPKEVAEAGARALDRALGTGEMQLFEYTLDTPEGKSWYEQRIAPLSADQVIAITRDISDRKRSELALQIRLTLLEYAADHTLQELLTKTLDEICELVNSSIGFYHFVEGDQRTLSLQAWSTRTVREFCTADGLHYPVEEAGVWADAVRIRQPVVHNDYAALPNRKGMPEAHAHLERELVVPILRQDRVVSILGVGNKPTFYTEQDVRLVSYIADIAWEITERKRIEDVQRILQERLVQSQKLETVGQLAGGIAHDFNNMLAVILMRCEMAMQQTAPNSPLHYHLTEIYKTGTRTAELTHQLLGFARKQMISPRVLDLNASIAGMISMIRRLIGEDIDLRWQPASDLWQVKMDSSQISQILVNLCVNARDAIDGAGSVTISTENSAIDALYMGDSFEVVPGDYVLLEISDDGSGMSKEVLAHLFEPFFTTKEVGKGTGLGLATVFGIVQQNHGQIRVYSEVGIGTTFKIYLPRYTDALAESPETPSGDILRGEGEHVLLVEDESTVLTMITESLRRLGYVVLPAGAPADALAIAAEHDGVIDLLITDVIMTAINGRQLAEQIAVHRPHIKRIFMSGYPADSVSQRALFDGEDHVLSKPFTLHQLATTVRRALDA